MYRQRESEITYINLKLNKRWAANDRRESKEDGLSVAILSKSWMTCQTIIWREQVEKCYDESGDPSASTNWRSWSILETRVSKGNARRDSRDVKNKWTLVKDENNLSVAIWHSLKRNRFTGTWWEIWLYSRQQPYFNHVSVNRASRGTNLVHRLRRRAQHCHIAKMFDLWFMNQQNNWIAMKKPGLTR